MWLADVVSFAEWTVSFQVASVRVGSSNQNELLEYVQSLGADAELLTKNASHDVLDAMTAFIDRCMGAAISPGVSVLPPASCLADNALSSRCLAHSVNALDAHHQSRVPAAGSNEHTDLAAITEYNVQELAPQLFWTTATGYMLRSLEVGLSARCAFQRAPCHACIANCAGITQPLHTEQICSIAHPACFIGLQVRYDIQSSLDEMETPDLLP